MMRNTLVILPAGQLWTYLERLSMKMKWLSCIRRNGKVFEEIRRLGSNALDWAGGGVILPSHLNSQGMHPTGAGNGVQPTGSRWAVAGRMRRDQLHNNLTLNVGTCAFSKHSTSQPTLFAACSLKKSGGSHELHNI